MGELGAGVGSDFPNALDTDNQKEKDYPAVDKTVQRADVPNDANAAILALEKAIGAYGSIQGHNATIWNMLRGINKKGCKVEWVDVDTAKVTAGVRWINGKLRHNPSDTNITFAANLDTGEEQENKRYAVWGVADDEETVMDYYISESFVQPSPGGTPAVNYEYLGMILNKSFNLVKQHRTGDWVLYDNGMTDCVVLSDGTEIDWTAVDLSPYMSATSIRPALYLKMNGVNNAGVYIRPTGSTGNGLLFNLYSINTSANKLALTTDCCPTNSSQSIDYKKGGDTNVSIAVLGYYDPID